MSEKTSREGSTRRWSSRRAHSDTILPPEYLEQLEQKRKQLDESIHKYIAAKEREFKQFEKETRQQYKLAEAQGGTNGAVKRRPASESAQDGAQGAVLEGQQTSAGDAPLETPAGGDSRGLVGEADDDLSRSDNQSTMAGLKDRGASGERDVDFVGLFTPQFLPALDDKEGRLLERRSSAPQVSPKLDGEKGNSSIERTFSDSAAQAKPKRPSHLALIERNSSSGSSADGKLASAMKSPTQRPKQKRVSLAVGDEIVAPSDNVPMALSHYSTSSHSRIKSPLPERKYPVSIKRSSTTEEAQPQSIEASLQEEESVALANAVSGESEDLQPPSPAAMKTNWKSTTKSDRERSKIDPDGDFPGLEEELDSPLDLPDMDDPDDVLESDEEITGRVEQIESSSSPSARTSTMRYSPTSGIITGPLDGEDGGAPYLGSGPSSAIASQQPTLPGFRRPSVVHDPVYRGANYEAAEKHAIDNEIYESSFSRLSNKGSFTAGSLGESYMARHAEEQMRKKVFDAQQETQVKS